MKTREDLAKIIDTTLEPYAVKNSDDANPRPEGVTQRQYAEPEHPFKLPFQRDRDRVIHCNSFRRLKHKTQVFISLFGDHYRDRLTHSMETSQIARSLACQLGLNQDVAEAIALTHDLGHTPFGHGGSDTLDEIMKKFGERFDHNMQSKRIVEVLENRYPDFPGLNLTWEVRQGLMKHHSPWENTDAPEKAQLSLEAQVVDLSDAIAYQAADLDDGLRADILTVDELKEVALWHQLANKLSNDYPLVEIQSDIGRYQISRMLINELVSDIVNHTSHNIKEMGINSLEKVYASQVPIATFSPKINEKVHELKNFLFKNFYDDPTVLDQVKQGQFIIKDLFEKFHANTELLPLHIQRKIYTPNLKHVVIKDYIAGMTDNFAKLTWQNLIER
ncbi:dNTP triphosphohydrolase [Candidatus Uhrbacteria bacterium]|nr:dNTP triphosphohydrolase [Candidatus Uhrbacteria bacterium]